jgi:hypothetical protein
MTETAAVLSCFFMISYLLVTHVSLWCWKTNRWFIFDWLMSYPNCNLVLNCTGSPRCYSSHDCKMESTPPYWNWPKNPIMTLFPMDGILLEVRNQKERYHA